MEPAVSSIEFSNAMTRGGDWSMSKIIEALLEEHRNIDKLLGVLEQELDVFDHRDRPDYEILQAVMQYFREYPDNYHHPKEDMVFAKLKLRDAAVAKRIGDVEADHVIETNRLHQLAQAVEFIAAGGEFLRQDFHDAVHNFIEHQRQHMQNEERSLFPAAVKALLPEDWAAIDARMANQEDPLFNDVIEKKYQSLHRTILQWERDTAETRKDMHRG
jgi:hemerythrin-like domain-containing protein